MREWIAIGICGAILLISLLILIIVIAKTVRHETNSDEEKCKDYLTAVRDSVKCNKPESDVTTNMWLAKRTESAQYYLLITKQVKSSFAISMVAALFGLVLFAVTIIIALIYKENLVISLIPAVSAAVIEVFSGIFLVMHRDALKQITDFSKQCGRDERIYSAILLARNNITDEANRDAVVTELIKSEAAATPPDSEENNKEENINKIVK